MRHLRHPSARRAAGVARADGAHGEADRPSRAGRRGHASRRRLRHRHAAAVDHRRGRRPPAACPTRTARSGWCATARSTTSASFAATWKRRATASRPRSDSETLIHLYAEHGDDFVERLNGMFAFALWDARRRRLLIGRDRLGIKPIYLHDDGNRIAFASEAKAILALPGLAPELDPAGAAVVSAARLRARAAVDVPRHRASFLPARSSWWRTGAGAAAATGRCPPRSIAPRPSANGSSAYAPAWKSRCGCRWSATSRSARSCPAASTRAASSRSWPGTATGRSRRIRSGSRAVPPRASTTSCRSRAGSPSGSGPITTRSSCGRTWSRCCRSSCGTWTSRSPTAPSSPPTSCPSSRTARSPSSSRAWAATSCSAVIAAISATTTTPTSGGCPAGRGGRPPSVGRQAAERPSFARPQRAAPRPIVSRLGRPAVRGTLSLVRRGVPGSGRRADHPRQRHRAQRSPPGGDARRHQRRSAAPHAGRGRGDAVARRPASAHRQDEHGGIARMPRAPARPRARRARRRHAAGGEDPWRTPEARDEIRARGAAAARHPRARQARLRHAVRRLAEGRARARGRGAPLRAVHRAARPAAITKRWRSSSPITRRTGWTAPTGCSRSSISRSGRGSSSTADRPTTSPAELKAITA